MKSRKLISVLLCLCLMVMLLPLSVMAANAAAFSDMPADYSTAALQVAAANGLLKGNDGKILPKANLTRAQMAAVVNRAFGATEKADVSGYTDVPAGAWYADDMAAAVHMKTFQGSGAKLAPQTPITRQEAFAVLARALGMADGSEKTLSAYTDGAAVATWAKGAVSAMVEAGYVHGSGAKLNPTAKMTRADFAVVMDSIVKTYISKAGEYTENTAGTVMVNVPGVTLKNITVSGDLIIGDGVGDGDVILDGVSVTGRTIVRGGGVHSIKVVNNSNLGTVVISKVDGNVRVAADDTSSVSVVVVNDGKDDVVVEGKVTEIKIETGDTPVTVQNATVDKVTVTAENAAVTVAKDATVKEVAVEEAATGANVAVAGTVTTVTAAAPDTTVKAAETAKITTVNAAETATNTSVETTKGASVGTVNAAAEGTSVSGEGTVTEANVTANNTSINTAGTKLEVAGTATGTKVGTTTVEAGTSGTTTAAGTVETKPAAPSGGSTPAPDYAAKVELFGYDAETRQQVIMSSKNYTTLEAAINAANSAQYRSEITVLKNTELSSDVTLENEHTFDRAAASPTDLLIIPEGKTLTVPEGKTLTNNNSININGSLAAGGTVTGKGDFDVHADSTLQYAIENYMGGTVALYDAITLSKSLTVPEGLYLGAYNELAIPSQVTVNGNRNVIGALKFTGGMLTDVGDTGESGRYVVIAPDTTVGDKEYGYTASGAKVSIGVFGSSLVSGEMTQYDNETVDGGYSVVVGKGAVLNIADGKSLTVNAGGRGIIYGTLNLIDNAKLVINGGSSAAKAGVVYVTGTLKLPAMTNVELMSGEIDNTNKISYPGLLEVESGKNAASSTDVGYYCGNIVVGDQELAGGSASAKLKLRTESASATDLVLCGYGTEANTKSTRTQYVLTKGSATLNSQLLSSGDVIVIQNDTRMTLGADYTLPANCCICNRGLLDTNGHKLTITAPADGQAWPLVGTGTFVVYDEDTLKDICAYANSNTTVKLGGDIALTAGMVEINKGQSITLDLNGYSLSRQSAKTAIEIYNNSSLSVIGTKANSAVNGTIAVGKATNSNGTLNINGGTYTATVNNDCAIQSNGTCQNCTITAENATFNSTDDTFYLAGGGTYTLTNCTVNGYTGIYMKGGALTMTGTTINATGAFAEPAANGNGASSTGDGIIMDAKQGYTGHMELTLGEGNSITSANGYAIREALTDSTTTATHSISIIGGTYMGNAQKSAIFVSEAFMNACTSHTSSISITGGTFSSSPSEYLASGYTASRDTLTGQYVVSASQA